MEGKLKSQYNKKPKNANESGQHGVQDNAFAAAEPMGMQPGMQQSMPSASYDSLPTSDSIMLPMTDIGPEMIPGPEYVSQMDLNLDQTFSWEMIGLGLEEPMPMQEAVDELYDLRPLLSWHANKTKNTGIFRYSTSVSTNDSQVSVLCLYGSSSRQASAYLPEVYHVVPRGLHYGQIYASPRDILQTSAEVY